jgi:ABC-type phosphate transport system auxiliary subunit
MNSEERIKLNELIRESGAEDTTQEIRRLKHSRQIREQVGIIQDLRRKHHHMIGKNMKMFTTICEKHASFLYSKYTDLFHRIVKNELDLKLLSKFILVLERIENGSIDQHEGSVEIGRILKEIYIDSALRKDKKTKKHNKPVFKKATNKISWKEFKALQETEE